MYKSGSRICSVEQSTQRDLKVKIFTDSIEPSPRSTFSCSILFQLMLLSIFLFPMPREPSHFSPKGGEVPLVSVLSFTLCNCHFFRFYHRNPYLLLCDEWWVGVVAYLQNAYCVTNTPINSNYNQ